MSDSSVIELDAPPEDFLPDEPEGAAFHQAFQASGIRHPASGIRHPASGIAGFDCQYLLVKCRFLLEPTKDELR